MSFFISSSVHLRHCTTLRYPSFGADEQLATGCTESVVGGADASQGDPGLNGRITSARRERIRTNAKIYNIISDDVDSVLHFALL